MLCLMLYKCKCFVFTRRVPTRASGRRASPPAGTGGALRRRDFKKSRAAAESKKTCHNLNDDSLHRVSAAFALVALAIVADAREMASVM